MPLDPDSIVTQCPCGAVIWRNGPDLCKGCRSRTKTEIVPLAVAGIDDPVRPPEQPKAGPKRRGGLGR